MTETQKQLVEETLQKICFKLFCKNCKSIAVSYPLDIENQAMIRAELDHALSTATQQAVKREQKLVDDVLDYDHWPNDKGKKFARLFLKSMIELSRSEALSQKGEE